MPYSNGNTEPSAPFIKTKELDWLQFSGVFNAVISGASYREGNTKDNKLFKSCDLDLAVNYEGKNYRARVSFFLPSNEMADLCYFLNMRNSAGQLEFPDYKEHDSKDGLYHFKDFPQIQGCSICLGLTYAGMSTSSKGNQFGTYNLVAFCNAQGQTAYEHFKQLPASRLAELKAITKANSAKQPASQSKQTYGGQQYQPQPQQTYQAPQPQTMAPQPQVQPQTMAPQPQVQPVAPQYQPQAQTMAAQAPQMAPVQLQGQTMMPTGRQFPDDIPF
jgi:hypothetical protein